MMEFTPFPKLARLSRECVVTEKIDGTNAQIVIEPQDSPVAPWPEVTVCELEGMRIAAGSRSRYIMPGKTTDNYGFAGWVRDNAAELVKLGPGRHFGEWWGKGVQRGYGINEKRFSLFDTTKWLSPSLKDDTTADFIVRQGIQQFAPSCCDVVPTLYYGTFDTLAVEDALEKLRHGSQAAPGFMNPEGIVVYHTHARVAFKKTFDDKHKEAA